MDILLSKVTQQAMNYAIRSGIVITSSYAMKQCSRLIKSVDNSTEKQELADLQLRLESKIRIISPAIDMIELISARGNTSLESAVILTKSLRWDIQSLGVRLAKAVGEEELQRRGSSRAKPKADNELEVKLIISDIKKLLARIEDAVPLINLAITTSGANLSSSLPSTVSPSRLLQASTFLTAGDTQYSMNPTGAQQIGPAFTLSMYMLFAGHIRPQDEEGIRETTWKEVIHKARVKLMRVPLDSIQDFTPSNTSHAHESIPASEGKAYEFAYQLLIIEDLDDDRVHTFEEGELQPGPFEDVARAGIREIIPIHQVSKIFYADTGKILNIGTDGETNNPILLLKRDVNAIPPRRMMERQAAEHWYDDYEEEESQDVQEESQDVREDSAPAASTEDDQSEIDAQLFRESSRAPEPEPQHGTEHYDDETTQPWRLPPNLDPEWVAFEVYVEESDSEDEDDTTEPTQPPSSTTPSGATPSSRSASLDPRLTTGFTNLNLRTPSPAPYHSSPPVPGTALQTRPTYSSPAPTFSPPPAPTSLPAIRTSLSLLEMLVRLTALQQFQQSSHLAIPDELLTFFLSESASTVGAGSDADLRRRVRRDAVRRVGFDPYDESPIKRRGEEYLEREMHGGGSQYDGEEREGTPYALQEGGEGDDRYYEDNPEQQQQRYYREDSSPTVRHLDASRHPQPQPHPHLHHPHRRVEPGARAAFANSSGGSGGSSSSPLRDRQYYASSSPLLPTHRDVPIPSREVSAQPSPLLRKATDRGGSGNGGGRLSVGERRRQNRQETPREER